MFTSMDTMKEDLQSLLFIDSNTKNRNSGYVDVFPHHYNHKDGYKTDKCGWDTINPNIFVSNDEFTLLYKWILIPDIII